MLRSNHLMIVQNAVEGSIDTIVEVVHHGVQLASLVADLPLGMDLADQSVSSRHKEASGFGDYLHTLIGEMALHRSINDVSNLPRIFPDKLVIFVNVQLTFSNFPSSLPGKPPPMSSKSMS